MAEAQGAGNLVSVVIPVYNVERFLPECIDTVLGQSYSHLEVILVDDGSTDSSGALCDRYAEQDARVQVIHQENAGVSAVRNRGLDAATGVYVYFLDSDDYIRTDAIEQLLQKADSDCLDVVFFDRLSVDENSVPKEGQRPRSGTYEGVHSGRNLFAAMAASRDLRVHVQLMFIRRDYLVHEGLRFYEGIVHEDVPFLFLLLMHDGRCGVLAKQLLFKRSRPGSIMNRRQNIGNVTGCLRGLEQMVDYTAGASFCGEVGAAVHNYVVYHFWNTYTRYYSMTRAGRKKHQDVRRQLFACMAGARYLDDPRIARRCRLAPFYSARRELDGLKRRVLRRFRLLMDGVK
jgi:glycosyltransferase involved in cell wall biosynthesis